MVSVLPSLLEARSGCVDPASWRWFPLEEEVADVPTLLVAIEALKAQGLTGPVVVRTFIHC